MLLLNCLFLQIFCDELVDNLEEKGIAKYGSVVYTDANTQVA